MSALREAFLDELKDLLDAELQLLKALPKMARAAENEGLQVAFEEHQGQTAEQIKRLGQVFAAFEEQMRGKKCKGMKGLIEEAEELIEEEEGDAALIAAAQKAEHYEIAAYGTLMSWAVALGHEEVVQILRETLEEEKATDKKLTVIAQTVVNARDSQRDSAKEEEPEEPVARRSRPKAAKIPSGGGAKAGRSKARAGGKGGKGKSSAAKSQSPRSKRLGARKRK